MILNSSKTKVMLVTTNQRHLRLPNDSLDLKINIETLNMITNDKILGEFVDNNLSWSDHIKHLTKKITSSTWLLSLELFMLRQIYQGSQVHIKRCSKQIT